jgi:hypothetical protein
MSAAGESEHLSGPPACRSSVRERHDCRLRDRARAVFVSCLHLEPGAWIADPPALRDSTLLVVGGEVSFIGSRPTGVRLELSGGVGLTLRADEHYRVESNPGAIILVVDAERLEPRREGLSTPDRVWGQRWLGEGDPRPRRRTWLSVARHIYYRLRLWPPVRRVVGVDFSGWWPRPTGKSLWERFFSGRRRGQRRPWR